MALLFLARVAGGDASFTGASLFQILVRLGFQISLSIWANSGISGRSFTRLS